MTRCRLLVERLPDIVADIVGPQETEEPQEDHERTADVHDAYPLENERKEETHLSYEAPHGGLVPDQIRSRSGSRFGFLKEMTHCKAFWFEMYLEFSFVLCFCRKLLSISKQSRNSMESSEEGAVRHSSGAFDALANAQVSLSLILSLSLITAETTRCAALHVRAFAHLCMTPLNIPVTSQRMDDVLLLLLL